MNAPLPYAQVSFPLNSSARRCFRAKAAELTFLLTFFLMPWSAVAAEPTPGERLFQRHSGGDPNANLKALPEVPPGFEVTLFAQEPLVRNPCSMAFDHRGRLFIGQGPQYRNPSPETPPDSVVMLTDIDGDGKADRAKTFATGLNCIQGLAWHGEDLWIANSPDLTVVRDLDGDDEADEYLLLYTDLGNIEHALHGLTFAPDGRVYWLRKVVYVYRPQWPGSLIQPDGDRLEEFIRGGQALFRPTDLEVGPEGDLYVLGWGTSYGVVWNNGQQANEGRVFRIAWKNKSPADRSQEPNRTRPLEQWTFPELAEDLGGCLPVWRVNAANEIVRRGASLTNQLVQWLARPNISTAQQTWGLWTLGRIAPKDPALDQWVAGRAQTGTANERLQSIRILGFRARRGGRALDDATRDGLRDSDPRLRLAAVLAIREAQATPFLPALRDASANEPDRGVYYALWGAIRELADTTTLKAMLKDQRAGVRGAALLALLENRALAPEEVTLLTKDPDPGTAEVAALFLEKSGISPPPALAQMTAEHDHIFLRVALKDISALSGRPYRRADTGLGRGARVYTDRPYSVTELSPELAGGTYVQTANDDDGSTGDNFLTVDLPCAMIVMIAHDTRLAQKPRWLSERGFRPTALAVRTTDALFKIWQREFPAGPVALGGNTPDGAERGHSHYFLILRPAPLPTLARPTTLTDALPFSEKADPARGEMLFFTEGGASCWSCHRVGSRGIQFGPDLTQIGDRNDPRHLIESMLNPEAVITEGYASLEVIMRDGEEYIGLLREETESILTLVQAIGAPRALPKTSIVRRQSLHSSAMPSYGETLGPQPIADLVSFLLAQRSQSPASAATNAPNSASFAVDLQKDRVIITRSEVPVATYVFRDSKVLRPYFANLHTPDGIPITRRYPPQAGKDSTDHDTMHPGLWLAFGEMNGHDFWRNRARIEHERFLEKPSAAKDAVTFTALHRYLTADGTPICRETCRIRWTAMPEGYFLLWESTFDPAAAELVFGDQEEMGLGVRVATEISVKFGNGRIENSLGGVDEKQTWGKVADWTDYFGHVNGRRAGVVLLPASDNFRPSWFHNRDYGVMVANPFGRKAFTGGEKSTVVIKRDEQLQLRFGVLLYAVPQDQNFDRAKLSQMFQSMKR